LLAVVGVDNTPPFKADNNALIALCSESCYA
jgi:hypothetical protein